MTQIFIQILLYLFSENKNEEKKIENKDIPSKEEIDKLIQDLQNEDE